MICHVLPSAKRRHTPLSVALLAILAPAFALPAAAQEQDTGEAPTNLDRITVTGSNIPRTDTETPSPVQVVTRQEIDRTGKTSLSDYLQTLTVDGAGSVPKTFGAGFASGGTGISLRGLGAGSTLILLNGRRMATYGLADDGQKVFTDLSTIPLDAVERVEVLKDGASAIYGSDAIAGVVNIILRDDFTGGVLRGSYGLSGDGDGDQKKATLTAGVGDLAQDGWNAYMSLDIGKSDPVRIDERRNRKWIGTGDIRRWGYDVGNNQFLIGSFDAGSISGNSVTGSVFDPTTDALVSLPGCSQLSDVTPQDPNDGCLWDVGRWRDLIAEEKYVNLFARATFAFDSGAEAYVEMGYSKKKNTYHDRPSYITGAWGYPGGPVNASSGPGAVVLSPDHPDNPYPGEEVRVRYAAYDVGARTTDTDNEFIRFLAGIKGSWGDWDYDTAYLHSSTNLVSTRTNFLRYSAVQCVLGNPDCPYGVWNIGQGADSNPQSLYDYISPTLHADAKTALDTFDFKVSRALYDLKGGPLGLAIGTEWRRTTNKLTPVTYTDVGDIIGLGYSAYDGTQNIYAGYVELNAPVLETLELDAAARYDKYESGDDAVKPKFGVKWTPIDWFALRGTYAEGFRAPNAAENGNGGSAGFSTARDPVRCAIDSAECGANPVAIITTPNPDLKPEESKSYSLGIVLQPTRTTSITVDAWRIKRTDEITSGSTAQAIANGDVVRDSDLLNGIPGTGSILAINVDYVNASSTKVEGIDTDIRQDIPMGAYGDLRLDLQWSHTSKFETTQNGVTVDYAGTHGDCNVSNCIGTPKDRVNFGATWDYNAWSVSGILNYVSGMDNIQQRGDDKQTDCLAFYTDGVPAPGGCELSSFTTFDLSANWKATDSLEIFGSVQNVFDRIAPLDPTTYGAVNYNPMHYSGAIGRYFTLGAKYSWN